MGSFSYNKKKKTLNMGPIFYKQTNKQKILTRGSNFLTEPKFWGFCTCGETSKITKLVKNGPIFQEKSLTMATHFCQNDP